MQVSAFIDLYVYHGAWFAAWFSAYWDKYTAPWKSNDWERQVRTGVLCLWLIVYWCACTRYSTRYTRTHRFIEVPSQKHRVNLSTFATYRPKCVDTMLRVELTFVVRAGSGPFFNPGQSSCIVSSLPKPDTRYLNIADMLIYWFVLLSVKFGRYVRTQNVHTGGIATDDSLLCSM